MPSNFQIIMNQDAADHFETSLSVNVTGGRGKDVSELRSQTICQHQAQKY